VCVLQPTLWTVVDCDGLNAWKLRTEEIVGLTLKDGERS